MGDMTGNPATEVGVTVVISTMDRPRSLARCLDALRAGTRRPVEVIVVDQGVRASAEPVVAAACRGGLAMTHLIQPRRGLSVSQNAGVRAARTGVVAIVDDDCVPDARWVEVVEKAFQGAERPLLLTGRVLPLPPEGDRLLALSTRNSMRRIEWTRPPLPWHIGTGGNFAVSQDAFLAVGGNDERLGTGTPGRAGNDLDLFHRLVSYGVPARYEPDLLVRHERSTREEYIRRRGSYGYGVGAMLGIWLRRGNLHALPVLAAWLQLRARIGYHRKYEGGFGDEGRVLVGTMAGLLWGLRIGEARHVRHG
jgi:glycosyltransferase involved in cell wall biosynthesis